MRFKSFVAATAVTAIVAAFCAAPAFAQLQQAPVPSPVCAECHAGAQHTTMLTAHGANNDANGSACQACHGDATAHAKDPTKTKPASVMTSNTATAAEKSAVCLTCHAGQRQLENWSIARRRMGPRSRRTVPKCRTAAPRAARTSFGLVRTMSQP